MGNQLSGIAPAQILSVDSYFSDLPEFQFQAGLGSTRFLKVARAKHKEGHVVIKVFVIQDLSLPVKSYQDQILSIAASTINIPNVLPFQRALITDRAGLMIRQYVHDNLYDRISTRPFLNLVEKKWIIFQLLSALEQLHNGKICHGDIKTENVLVTSWNWVLLADIASFKPVYLPADNPADFNYFFDTSRRRTCHIAPERFVDTGSRFSDSTSSTTSNGDPRRGASPNLPLLDLPGSGQGELRPAMDIFSAGCVIAELFLEGAPLFDLSQLLSYRAGEFSPESKLSKIDHNIRSMVQHMVAKNPNERLSAKEYMDLYRGHVFPEEFYTFLKSYLAKFVLKPVLTPDEKIMRIYHDLDQIKKALLPENPDNESEKLQLPESDNCFVMIASLVTSVFRTLKFSQTKLTALDLLVELSHYLSDEVILERLLPYMFHLVDDAIPRVRAKSIEAITKCLAEVKNVPRSEGNVFPEYVLLNLSHLANDPEVIVQVAFAENIALLAETALRFLETIQINNLNTVNQEKETQMQYQGSYDVELLALHDMIQNKVVALLTDSDHIVKRTLLEKGLSRLCVFFGRQKANAILLSHMITYLNDKQDWHLRGAFFDNVIGVAAYVGFQSMTILKPLLQQGLKDTEEFVVCKAIKSLTSLAELGLLQKPILLDFVKDTTPFLCHPNVWIRYAAVGYVCICARILNVADTYCFLMPLVKPVLKQPVIQLDSESIVLSVLQDPIPRAVYEYLIKSTHVEEIFKQLENKGADSEAYGEGNLAQIFRKMRTHGMTPAVETKLIRLKDVILKLNSAKSSDRSKSNEYNQPGVLELTSLDVVPTSRALDLERMSGSKGSQGQGPKRGSGNRAKQEQVPVIVKPKPASIPEDTKNEETTKVSVPAASANESESPEKDSSGAASSENVDKPENQTQKQDPKPEKPLLPSLVVSPSQTLTDQPKYAKCKMEFRALAMHKKDQYIADVKAQALVGTVMESRGKQSNWKPKGQLVAHLQEHSASVNRVVVSDDCAFFASASSDSTVRIWESQRMETKSLSIRSKATYSKQVGKINCLTFCENSYTMACSSDDASIHVFRIELVGPQKSHVKIPLLVEKRLNVKEEGMAVDMHQYDTASQKIIAYATVHGYICGWDLRIPTEKFAWKLKNDCSQGLITSFAVDPYQCWLGCGTSDGAVVCWDMRFQIPITQIRHPKKYRVRRIISHPLSQSLAVSSFNGNNEVATWDMETSERRQTLWASSNPPFTYAKRSNDAVTAMHISDQEARTFLITGGSDKRIRLWDMRQPENSSIVAGAGTDHLDHVNLKYTSRVIDGSEVIYENLEKARPSPLQDESPRKGPDEPPTGHHDCITDIAITKIPQNLIISSSSDGVIKVWK